MKQEPKNQAREHRIHVRISANHDEWIRRKAKELGMGKSELMRWLIASNFFAQGIVNFQGDDGGRKRKPGQPRKKIQPRKRWGPLLYGKLARPQTKDE